MYLAIDPGIDTGWAIIDTTGTLVACGLGQDFPTRSCRVALIEKPQVYRAVSSKGNPNDLITLAILVGRYAERLTLAGVCVDLVTPASWKGQIPKDVHHARVVSGLSAAEVAILDRGAIRPRAKTRDHNVLDAVALAKWGHVSGRFSTLRGAR
jgi:hypothetical protein